MDRKHRLNLILTFVLAIVFLYVGLVVTFFLIYSLPGDIALLILPPSFTQQEYDWAVRLLGLNDPLFFRFLRYLGDFLRGDWGNSYFFSGGAPVNLVLQMRFSRTIELLILPLLIGLNLGFIFGKISKRTKRNWLKMGIQLLSAVGIAVPIFFFGMMLQYLISFQLGWLPAIGYKTAGFSNPPLITGFRILDSIISGNWHLAVDTIEHYILPVLILTVAITALMTRVFSPKLAEDSYKKKTILSITAKTSAVFGVILTYLFLIEVTFNLNGIGDLFLSTLRGDFFVLRGFMFLIIILLVITIFVSNLRFTLTGLVKDKKHPPQKDLKDTTEREPKISAKIELKNYLHNIVRSPITIIGLILVIIPIFISIFPQLVTVYTFDEAHHGLFMNPWAMPSPDHPLGTSKFGRDILAQVVYGTRDSLIFGFGAVLIGLIGGSIFGPLASKFNRVGHTIITSFMLIFYVLPGIVLVIFFAVISYPVGLLMFTTGFLLIPSFTRIIANAEFRPVTIGKKIISYVPLFAGFAILLYVSLGFLGFSDWRQIQLGNLINIGRERLWDITHFPHAVFWPGLIAFLIVIGLFVLHEGLAKSSR